MAEKLCTGLIRPKMGIIPGLLLWAWRWTVGFCEWRWMFWVVTGVAMRVPAVLGGQFVWRSECGSGWASHRSTPGSLTIRLHLRHHSIPLPPPTQPLAHNLSHTHTHTHTHNAFCLLVSSFQARSQNCWKRLLASSCLSVRPSVGSHWTDFLAAWYLSVFEKV
jgi:hypothetical protein